MSRKRFGVESRSLRRRRRGLSTIENRADLANEINEAINTLQIASPNISWSEVQNVLIAAYCHVVARKPGLAAAEKWAVCVPNTLSELMT